MKVRFSGMTDTGLVREANEDNFFISEMEALCVVADGMGGHKAGEVASKLAVDTIKKFYEDSLFLTQDGNESALRAKLPGWPFKLRRPEHTEERRLVQSVLLANQAIYEHACENEESKGMGTTLVSAYFLATGCYLVHVGDSRAYRLRDGELERLSKDHSLANEYVEMGLLRPEEVKTFPYKNVITRACGLSETVEPESEFHTLQNGDLFLFCSDGLTDPLSDDDIRKLLKNNVDLDQTCEALLDAANDGGGPDNITVVLAEAIEE